MAGTVAAAAAAKTLTKSNLPDHKYSGRKSRIRCRLFVDVANILYTDGQYIRVCVLRDRSSARAGNSRRRFISRFRLNASGR